MAASVVDLPEPVGPVTSTRPDLSEQISLSTSGMCSSSSVRIRLGIWRMTQPMP